jgi:hypothetical protein
MAKKNKTKKQKTTHSPSVTHAAAVTVHAPHGSVATPRAVVADANVQRFVVRKGRQRVKDEPSLEVFDTLAKKAICEIPESPGIAEHVQFLLRKMERIYGDAMSYKALPATTQQYVTNCKVAIYEAARAMLAPG